MNEDIVLPFDLPSVCRKKLSVAFDGGMLSSDAGVLLLRRVERRLGLAARLSSCLKDKRDPDRIEHTVEEMLRLRMFAIAAGYEDANDCNSLRHDPVFKMAVGRLPESGDALCSQPTMSRLENAPSKIEIARMMAAMVDQFCDSYSGAPSLDHARHRRHVRCGARPSAIFAVQRPLRRALLPADPHLRRGERQAGGGDPARRQDARRRGGAHHPQTRHRAHPPPLAQGPHPGARRQPLWPGRSDGMVRKPRG